MKVTLISFSVVVFSIILYEYLKVDLIEQCELEKCPYCYGTDLCKLFFNSSINLVDDSLIELITNHFSVKNVFYAEMYQEKIVLKKLAHTNELQQLDEIVSVQFSKNYIVNFTKEILNILTVKRKDVSTFKVCSESDAVVFTQEILSTITEDNLKHIWTILQINVEPLLLQILDSKWPIPKYLGACGRLIAQTYCGTSLNSFENVDWFKRAYLAYQLLIAAKNFTFSHSKYAFYLTDISPDNIAVDSNLKLSFIDLENVIVKLKTQGFNAHHSTHYEENQASFLYSEEEICSSHLSDHNFYAICKLLLASDAPWPMMHDGLLHSAPLEIDKKLFDSIDLCVKPMGSITRFEIAENILDMLKSILNTYGFNKTL